MNAIRVEQGGSVPRPQKTERLQPVLPIEQPLQLREAQETLLRNGAIALGNRALRHIAADIFDQEDGYIIASVGGTFHRPFWRDALVTQHLIRKAIENTKFINDKAKKVWNDISQDINRSFAFLRKYQKPDGFYPHEMEHYEGPKSENHPMLKEHFYTHEKGAKFMINGDSVDATPRLLMEAVRLLNPDEAREFTPQALKAFTAMWANMDEHDGFLTYDGHTPGLMSQGWMDSWQGRPLDEEGNIIPGSVALIEVQAYAWSSMKRWGNLLQKLYPDDLAMQEEARKLFKRADYLKRQFNDVFRTHDDSTNEDFFAHALVLQPGGKGIHKDSRISINAGLAVEADVRGETIFATDDDIRNVVAHLYQPTMFHKDAGIFTFDAKSVNKKQKPNGYHYDEFVAWPFASMLAAEGVVKVAREKGWKEIEDIGNKMMLASMMPMLKTYTDDGEEGTFLEQFTFTPNAHNPYVRYIHEGTGEQSNSIQTWSVAALVRGLGHFQLLNELDSSQYEYAKTRQTTNRRSYRTVLIYGK